VIPKGPLSVPKLSRGPDLVWRVPGSKSITNRALVLAALADGESRLEGVLESDDTRHMRTALEAIGIGVERAGDDVLMVRGGRGRLVAPAEPLFVGNSGTTVRFLTALACLVPGEVTLVGDAAMARRPIRDLVDGLRQLGADIRCDSGCPPITVRGGRLSGGRLRMRGDRSSQYFSAVLMAAGLAEGDVEVGLDGELVSRPYVEITRRMIEDFGGSAAVTAEGFAVRRGAYHGRRYVIEPDASSASYAFSLAAATGGCVEVPGLGVSALQGDYGFVEVLGALGADVERAVERTRVRGTGRLSGIDVDMHHISDTVMTLAALGPLCGGAVRIRNVENIRIKETDRLAATVAELERLGQHVTSGPDWLCVEPRPLTPALVHTYEDHRMAMSFAVLGAAAGGVTIEDPRVVAKTYPGFWDDLARAYAAVGAPAPW
jgi:3-phosphoshikimate 1-carboxyvinyltransferase